MAILNYDSEGLDRLEKTEVNANDNAYGYQFNIEAVDSIAIFGEVTNVKIGYVELYTEGNFMPTKTFDSLKDTQLFVHRSNDSCEMFMVSFFDAGMREHTYYLTADEYYTAENNNEQTLVSGLDEKDKVPSSYDDAADLFLSYLGMTEDQFESNHNFTHVEKEYGSLTKGGTRGQVRDH
ncbi:MAG: hypothetical protein U9N81_08595 [Bacillota bacterium]|nr:hypothetical protein [Bacillota bacterium]